MNLNRIKDVSGWPGINDVEDGLPGFIRLKRKPETTSTGTDEMTSDPPDNFPETLSSTALIRIPIAVPSDYNSTDGGVYDMNDPEFPQNLTDEKCLLNVEQLLAYFYPLLLKSLYDLGFRSLEEPILGEITTDEILSSELRDEADVLNNIAFNQYRTLNQVQRIYVGGNQPQEELLFPFTTIEYGNMTGHATSFIDQNIFYNISQDTTINSPEYIYRPEDSNFGMKQKPNMLMMAGLEAKTLTTFQQQMEQNHSPKTLYFGDIKTAVAKQGTTTIYEVVYIDVKDNLVNNSGTAVTSAINLRSSVIKPILGPRASSMNATADYVDYEITTDGGLSFSTSGSKVRFANQLSADLGMIETLYPNAVANMRSRMKSLGHKEWTHLPLWMKTTQSGDLAPLGYVMAVPICYCKPGKSGLVKKRIEDKKLNFKNIKFTIDRYVVNKSKVATETFTGDGSTTSFVVDELIHEEDILVKEGSSTVFVGQGVTADNNIKPTYLTADGTLRSADHELGITLSHNTTTKKTTITFTKEVPQNGTLIKVERSNDKYLKFRDKGI